MSSRKVKQVYLAGAIERAPDGGIGWRKEITPTLKRMGFKVFNPCIETDGLLAKKLGWKKFAIEKWRDLKENNPTKFTEIGKWIVDQDLIAVDNSDIMIVYFDKYVTMGAGTYGEITVARYLDMPAYVLIAQDFLVKDIPLWVTGCATEIVTTQEELVDILSSREM